MKKSLILGSSGLVVIGLALGAYFVWSGNPARELFGKKDKLASDLTAAQGKLSIEKGKLGSMMAELRDSHALAVNAQEQMKRAASLVAQTNFMFAGATGENPEFLAKNPISGIDINDERKNVNVLIAGWEEEMDIYSLDKIGLERSERIREEIETVRAYIYHLNQIVAGFTTQNSGLSKLQIDRYLEQLPSLGTINEILASLDFSINTAIQTAAVESSNNNYEDPPVASSGGGSTGTGTEVAVSPQSPSPSPSSNQSPSPASVNPPATVSTVVHQQQVVAEAEAEVAAIQEQLAAAEEQIEQANQPVSPETPVAADPAVNPSSTDQNLNDESSNDTSPNDPYHGLEKYKGIIVQPGPPQLIQGTNQY